MSSSPTGGGSDYERRQVDFFLDPRPQPIEPGSALVVLLHGPYFSQLHDIAIAPALAANGLNRSAVRTVFNDASPLPHVCEHLLRADVVIVDVTHLSPSVMYVLGL